MWVLNSPQIIQPPFSHLPINTHTFYSCSITHQNHHHSLLFHHHNHRKDHQSKPINSNIMQERGPQTSPSTPFIEPNPTQQTYELLILTCSRQKALYDAFDVHRNLVDNRFDHDPFLGTKLIDMYSELECIEYGRQVFDKMTRRTIYVWNAILRALTLAGYGVEALGLYRDMNGIGAPCDRFTHTYALKGLCGVRVEFDVGREREGDSWTDFAIWV